MSVSGPRTSFVLIFAVLLSASAGARKNDDKTQVVDAGSFVIMVNGQRVATETFHIDQSATGSTASSEVNSEQGEKTVQKTELQITPAGDLRRYEWHQLAPAKAQIVVEPADQFLVEHVVPEPPQHPVSQSFLLPASTTVLDDFFFSQREILAWRYLAQACGGKLQQCHPAPAQFGVLVPQQRSSLVVTLEYAGPEKVNLNGVERELNRLTLKVADEPDWLLYLDMNLKLVRIVIPAANTEVVRQ